jgi:hypothetical protein
MGFTLKRLAVSSLDLALPLMIGIFAFLVVPELVVLKTFIVAVTNSGSASTRPSLMLNRLPQPWSELYSVASLDLPCPRALSWIKCLCLHNHDLWWSSRPEPCGVLISFEGTKENTKRHKYIKARETVVKVVQEKVFKGILAPDFWPMVFPIGSSRQGPRFIGTLKSFVLT